MSVIAPCYNYERHQDCRKRHPGCHIICDKWNKYVTARNDIYKQREIERNAFLITGEVRRKSLEKSIRRGRRLWS